MKNLKISRVLFLLISFWFVVGLGQAVELGVVDLEVFYQKKVNSLREELDKQIAAEHRRYLVEVQQSFAKFQKMGQLGPALLANREIEFLKKTILAAQEIPERPGLDEFGKSPRLRERRILHDTNLGKISKNYEVSHREAAEKLIKLLQGKVKSLTQKGYLVEAKEAQRFAESIRKEFPKQVKDDRNVVDLETWLPGTTWTYHDQATFAKRPGKLVFEKGGVFVFGSRRGEWKVENIKTRSISLTTKSWPKPIEITIGEKLKTYEGKYLVDGTRRHGKLDGKAK